MLADSGKRTAILRRSLIFSGLSDDDLKGLSELAVSRIFRGGESIFWEGDPAAHFYVVASGRIKVVKHSSLGKEFVVAFFGPGDVFGEVAAFEEKPYPATAQAVSEAEVLRIGRDRFLAFLSEHPAVALRIINMLGGRLRDAQNRLNALAGERAEQRVARTLLMLSSKLGQSLPFTRQEIADMSGTTIETTIRVMSRMKKQGIIQSHRGKTDIVDESGLRLLSEGSPTA
ncbi:MAG: Crp/Fnr family transcriptional regulator [Dehalococcoidia bacterium]|nr:Crp/Fnr family transcriptional regulator [Dehalococcoidia bacterium]